MQFTNYLLTTYTDLDINDYLIKINKTSNNPISETLLLDLLDISLNNFIHYTILIKYEIISEKTNVLLFLKKYIKYPMFDGRNYYITNDDLEKILFNETNILHECYILVLKYIKWYNLYQHKLKKILILKDKYDKLIYLLDEIKNQLELINSMKNLSAFEKEIDDFLSMETKINELKTNICNKINKVIDG
jgi:hypothetical protein